MGKRLSSIRRGILYQDLVAAEALLRMVNGDPDPPQFVCLEDRRGGAYDDVRVTYADRTEWKQVKWAQNPGAEPLTIDLLGAAARGKTPPIGKFGASFLALCKDDKPWTLQLITNRSPDTEFRGLVGGHTSRIKARLTKVQKNRIRAAWLEVCGVDESQFGLFLSKLAFFVNAPDIDQCKTQIQTQLRLLGCVETSFGQLMAAIADWAQDEAKERITRSDVEQVLGRNFETPDNAFQLPIPRIDRSESRRSFLRQMASLDSGYLVLLGSPGSGKSTLLNSLVEDDGLDRSHHLIVYNCFTGTSDSFLRTRARADNFVKFLTRRLHEEYGAPGLTFEPSSGSIESLLSRASARLPPERKLLLVIDGLDYASRYAPRESAGLFFHLPPSLPPHVVIVASAQAKEQLPAHLQALSADHYAYIEALDLSEVDALLEQHGVYARAERPANDRQELSRQVWELTNGHALHVNYAALKLTVAARGGGDLAQAIATMPKSQGDIEAYYRTVLAPPAAALARESLSIMASCPFELSMAEVAGLMQPIADARAVDDALRSYAHLFRQIGGRFYFSHDSLRVFANLQVSGCRLSTSDQIAFLGQLDKDPRIGDHLLHLAAEEGADFAVTDGIDCGWLADQIATGASIALLNEGLTLMALAALRRQDWKDVARWWCLQACLQRAEFEGTFTEATLISVWLSLRQVSLVERYIFVSGHFLSQIYPGPDMLDLLEAHGENELAERVRSRQLSQPAPEIGEPLLADDFGNFVRHASRRLSAQELLALIRNRVETSVGRRDASFVAPLPDPAERVAEFVDQAIYECLAAADVDRVGDWLNTAAELLPAARLAEHFLRLRLLRHDLAAHSAQVRAAIEVVEDWQVLVDLVQVGGFDDEVRAAAASFELNPLLRNRIHWLDRGQTGLAAHDLVRDVAVSSGLAMRHRLTRMREATRDIKCQVGRVFTSAIVRLVESVTVTPDDWRRGLQEFIQSIRRLVGARFSSHDIDAAQGFVGSLGTLLRPMARNVRRLAQEAEFGGVVESQLIPALQDSGINYEAGHLSISDMLLAEKLCHDLSLGLIRTVEGWYSEAVEFKATSLIDLASHFSRAGDISSAERTLRSGTRASFTYGYRKDTTLNDFLAAFCAVAPHLDAGQFRSTTEFITKAILILDELTDGRMLYYASSYFCGLVSRYDLKLGACVAQHLSGRCRQLRPHWVVQAATEHGVDIRKLKSAFSKWAPALPLTVREEDSDESGSYQPRHEFVTSDKEFPQSPDEMVQAIELAIDRSAYGTGFGGVAGLVKAFVARNDVPLALDAFAEFQSALRQMLQPYPLADVELAC